MAVGVQREKEAVPVHALVDHVHLLKAHIRFLSVEGHCHRSVDVRFHRLVEDHYRLLVVLLHLLRAVVHLIHDWQIPGRVQAQTLAIESQ